MDRDKFHLSGQLCFKQETIATSAYWRIVPSDLNHLACESGCPTSRPLGTYHKYNILQELSLLLHRA